MAGPDAVSCDALTVATRKGGRDRYYRCERTRVEGAIQTMFNFVEQGIVSPQYTDFTTRLATQRSRRAALVSEILLVERQLSSTDGLVTPEAIERLGQVIFTRLRSTSPAKEEFEAGERRCWRSGSS